MRLSLLTRIALGVVLPMIVWSSGVLLLFVGLKGHLPLDLVGWLVVLEGLALVITVLSIWRTTAEQRRGVQHRAMELGWDSGSAGVVKGVRGWR